MQIDIATLVRENIKALLPYSSARAEFTGTDGIFLNANENSFGSPLTKPYISKPYNRYPDPSQTEL
jgi:histidinol-phosphate aminotransferase